MNGATDWEAHGGDGAYFTTQVTIDNTDPEILQAASFRRPAPAVEAPGTSRYLAAIAVYDAAGTLLDRYAPNQTVEAQTQTATFNLGTLAEPRILIQAYDYAMNLATYRVTIGQPGGEKTESITLNPTELELTKGNSRDHPELQVELRVYRCSPMDYLGQWGCCGEFQGRCHGR
ncbi:MAG: hypothetical protein ACLSHU_13330 [Oscillospiraceae bacterium]